MRAIYEEKATEVELAHQLAELRRRAGKTQAELADILGTTQSAVARVETGRRARLETVVRYARACGHRNARLALVDDRGRPLVRVQPR